MDKELRDSFDLAKPQHRYVFEQLCEANRVEFEKPPRPIFDLPVGVRTKRVHIVDSIALHYFHGALTSRTSILNPRTELLDKLLSIASLDHTDHDTVFSLLSEALEIPSAKGIPTVDFLSLMFFRYYLTILRYQLKSKVKRGPEEWSVANLSRREMQLLEWVLTNDYYNSRNFDGSAHLMAVASFAEQMRIALREIEDAIVSEHTNRDPLTPVHPLLGFAIAKGRLESLNHRFEGLYQTLIAASLELPTENHYVFDPPGEKRRTSDSFQTESEVRKVPKLPPQGLTDREHSACHCYWLRAVHGYSDRDLTDTLIRPRSKTTPVPEDVRMAIVRVVNPVFKIEDPFHVGNFDSERASTITSFLKDCSVYASIK